MSLIKQLIKKGANVNVAFKGHFPGDLFHDYIDPASRIEMLEILLQAGADPNFPGPKGLSPLFLASIRGEREAMRMLIQYGARAPDPFRDSDSYSTETRKQLWEDRRFET